MNIQKKISLVQPNRVTNARYSFTEREENILTLIIDQLQDNMRQNKEFNKDLFGQPTVIVDVGSIGIDVKKLDYYNAAKGLMQKIFSFDWNHSQSKHEIETAGILITTVHNIRATSIIEITLNPWALPYLLYWGKGIGGTIFNKTIALSLPGEYTKRLYKFCKRFEDKGGFSMTVDQFRDTFLLGNKYPRIADVKRRILEPSMQRMKDSADVYYKYTFSKTGKTRAFNLISFKIYGNNKALPMKQKTGMYELIYNVVNMAYPNHIDSRALDFCEKIQVDTDQFEKLYMRLKKVQNEFQSKERDINTTIPYIKHILKEDYNF